MHDGQQLVRLLHCPPMQSLGCWKRFVDQVEKKGVLHVQAHQPGVAERRLQGAFPDGNNAEEAPVLLDTPRGNGWISMRMGRIDDALPALNSAATSQDHSEIPYAETVPGTR